MRRLVLASLLVATAGAASAQELRRGPAAGQHLFMTYCAACHGVLADGNGPVAEQLVKRPPDLTTLSDRYGVPLPVERIAAFIDGRDDVLAHGPREMPVWGQRFFDDDPALSPNAEGARRRTIRVIVEYLESIQSRVESRADSAPGG